MAKPHPAPDHDNTDAFAAAVREGIADAESGRTVAYEDARRWLLSWGTDVELSFPDQQQLYCK